RHAFRARGQERVNRQRYPLRRARNDRRSQGTEEGDVGKRGLGAGGWGLLALACALAASADAQPQTRKATNLAALLAYPGFYHGRPIVIVGKVGLDKNQLRVTDDAEHSLH